MRAAPVRKFQKGGQPARRKAAPPGAAALKGSLLVSMCQIAWVKRLATSIWASLAPRWLPSRRFVSCSALNRQAPGIGRNLADPGERLTSAAGSGRQAVAGATSAEAAKARGVGHHQRKTDPAAIPRASESVAPARLVTLRLSLLSWGRNCWPQGQSHKPSPTWREKRPAFASCFARLLL